MREFESALDVVMRIRGCCLCRFVCQRAINGCIVDLALSIQNARGKLVYATSDSIWRIHTLTWTTMRARCGTRSMSRDHQNQLIELGNNKVSRGGRFIASYRTQVGGSSDELMMMNTIKGRVNV
jgi:hypothetical protein